MEYDKFMNIDYNTVLPEVEYSDDTEFIVTSLPHMCLNVQIMMLI